MIPFARRAVVLAALWAACVAWANAADKPLTLEEALRAAETEHPAVQLAQAELALAAADLELAGARSSTLVFAQGALQRVKPQLRPPGTSDYLSDNYIRLGARKTLYDFGRTANAESAAQAVVEAREANLLETRDLRRIEIMERFFDVLLADLRYTADNEYMAVAFVNFDNTRERFEQKLVSQVDVLEAEARYQEWLVRRNDSLKRQRLTRALLANAMNQPDKLPVHLVDPELKGNDRVVPDYAELVPILLASNPRLKAQQRLLDASRQRLESLRAEQWPTLDAELEFTNWGTARGVGRDEQRAGLILNWPLYQGARVSGQIAKEQAQFYRLQAETERLKRDLTQSLLTLWMEIDQLKRTARNAARQQVQYRDLVLERARGQYEVELKTNLGDSMAATMDAKFRQRAVDYQLAVALAKLEALLGQPLPETSEKP